MEPVWLQSYSRDVPRRLDLDPDETLVDIFDDVCREFRQRPAFANLGHVISYGELDELSARFAGMLQDKFGIEPGARLAIMMPNLLQYPVALFGALRAGLVVVNVNPLYTADELRHQLKDSGAEAIVIVANSASVLEMALTDTQVRHVVITEIGDLLPAPKRQIVNFVVRWIKHMVPRYRIAGAVPFRDCITQSRPPFRRIGLQGKDLAFLQYTGGTTGVAKGAMLTHSNMVANTRQVNAWFPRADKSQEIVMTPLPLYHVYALTCNCMAYLAKGGLDVLVTDPRDTAALIREMKKWKFTAITGVNTLYQRLASHPDIGGVDFSQLKIASAGGMAVLKNTAMQWAAATGTEILEGYGLSETSPVLTSNPADIVTYTGSIGLPLPNTEISLRDEAGHEVPVGEMGELCARGPQVMAGYWQRPEETAEVMTPDGFLRTGDIATVDQRGFFKIVDRKKDMINVSGFKVFPNEVENVLAHHPDVLEVACIGVPYEKGGESVKVFVVLRAGAKPDAEALRDYCREHLTAYKVPHMVQFLNALPKSNVGKVLRRELR